MTPWVDVKGAERRRSAVCIDDPRARINDEPALGVE
jgi:hypothetical protein